MNRSTWIGPADPRWNEALRRLRHDAYHRPEYVALAARHEGGDAAAFLWSSRGRQFVIPLVLKALQPHLGAPDTWRDAFSPYGYASPLIPSDASESEVAEFLRAFSLLAARHDVITAFIRLHPLLPLPTSALRSAGELVKHGRTVFVDLGAPEEALTLQMRRDIIKPIRKLGRLGFTAHFDQWEDYAHFIAIYRETMDRVGARDYYQFSDGYFYDLQSQLGSRVHLCTIRAPGGDIASAGIFFASGDFVQQHFTATASRYLPLSPAKLLVHSVRVWSKERGYRFFHLGGGVGGMADTLFHFKSGFSNSRGEFCTLRIIVDAKRYEWLRYQSPEPCAPADGWFPVYRTLADR